MEPLNYMDPMFDQKSLDDWLVDDSKAIIPLQEEEDAKAEQGRGEMGPRGSGSDLSVRAKKAAAEPNVLSLDKIGEKIKMPPIDLKAKYKKGPSGKTKRARHFQITLNEVEKFKDLKDYLMGLKNLNYIIACEEVAPTTGHIHNHIYCQFSAPTSLNFKSLCEAHLEECMGSAQQNIKYIKKEDQPDKRGKIILEWGEPRLSGDMSKLTLKEAKEKTLDELEGGLSLLNYKAFEYMKTQKANEVKAKEDHKKVKVVYIWGPTGSGKSLWAQYQMRNIPYNEVKHTGEFWHGVSDGAKACIYDDFRDSHMMPSEFINFIDYTCHNLNIKGGSVKNNYKYIIITSIQDPNKLYPNFTEKDDEPKKQWLRRMKVIYAPDVMGETVKQNYMRELGWLDEEEDDDDPFKGLNF